MALTANQIVALACESAHSPGKVDQARALLNAILSDLCETYDSAAARGQFLFTFNPSLVGAVNQWPGAAFGSGPYVLPVDYLRTSGSSGSTGAQRSSIWYLQGVPYPMVPCDLSEFDMQVQQAGLNSYPWLWATDMASPTDDRIVLETTGDTAGGSVNVTMLADTTRLAAGLGIAGQAITPGATVLSVSGNTCVLSNPATESVPQASLMFGFPPSGWTYPPPSAALQVMIRYQRRMPEITDFSRYPWFDNTGYLIEKLVGRLCMLNDDSRADKLLGGPDVVGSPDNKLKLWLAAKDDDANRAKTVQLDRRVFGQSFPLLQSTKKIGW